MTTPMRVPPSEPERERAAELLQRAAGDGRLTLEQFSVRVGAVWAADTPDELARATDGLDQTPIVGSASTVDQVVTVFSENKRRGRWRLRTPRLKVFTMFGATELDLREVLTGADVIEIAGTSLFGEFKVIVPEGVEVDLSGTVVFSSRNMHLAAVPRVAGTPEVRIHLTSWFSNVEVVSKPYKLPPA
ncbi:hypothetical protein Aab01nite_67490 [Paractinoplanes abujensis]|uniref:DUF1707 domain-containing protein n=1 Tax=Paractinoplanes abujensis TaxID=882441 RepID=A0A7W7G4R3_9ACTN|nr:DUF1707 domain-containing protein [Actinoplanes abujensis]MBB4695575.1 hypothetical protein [Actinoplanes abujensis]GID23159.1 hypothetical protein Aab01nite_67490 [Actinoplanes abujensis]